MSKPLLHFAGDHAGFNLKKTLLDFFDSGFLVNDLGPFSEDSCDYPDFAHLLAEEVLKTNSKGILICGSGNGVCISANRHAGIRAALCWQPELATLAVQHNNANVLCIPARFISEETAKQIVWAFLSATFEGGRHQRRIDKIEI